MTMQPKTWNVAGKKRNAQDSILGSARSMVAMGTLAAYAAMGASRPTLAAVWKNEPADGGAAATLPLKRFDIPAGPLDGAIFSPSCW